MEEIIKIESEKIYREYPTEPKCKEVQTFNRDTLCFKKRKAFIKGAHWIYDKLTGKINDLQKTIDDRNSEIKRLKKQIEDLKKNINLI